MPKRAILSGKWDFERGLMDVLVYFFAMKQSFTDHHIHQFLKLFREAKTPLDLSLSNYFRSNKSLGSKDRRTIGDTLYGMTRWKSLIDYFSPRDPVAFYQEINWDDIFKDPMIPEDVKLALPEFLYIRFCAHFGKEKTEVLGKILNETAPTTIRINPLKTTREHLLNLWKEKFSISPCLTAPHGITFQKREPLFSLLEFKEGLFEIQDEGSQLIGEQILVNPGDTILDYCSGSGGKTLGFAYRTQGKGQIYLHDIRESALLEAKKRLKRAGIQNAQCLEPNHKQLSRLPQKCDWVLLDLPCSGSGTLRRNPDQKWKIDATMVEHLVHTQRSIVKEALKYVKPGGRLVYATCSILPEENEFQVDYILKNFPLTLENEPLALLPQSGGMDGFFSAIFRKDPL